MTTMCKMRQMLYIMAIKLYIMMIMLFLNDDSDIHNGIYCEGLTLLFVLACQSLGRTSVSSTLSSVREKIKRLPCFHAVEGALHLALHEAHWRSCVFQQCDVGLK